MSYNSFFSLHHFTHCSAYMITLVQYRIICFKILRVGVIEGYFEEIDKAINIMLPCLSLHCLYHHTDAKNFVFCFWYSVGRIANRLIAQTVLG